ncbi:MAG: TfoX/Sxy family protein [Betaproteobacteria bacterium]|nr:TfoX/Sxy family protein [Betaproteobacteria bacterium]
MAFDEGLAERIRGILQSRSGIVEKNMFGGIAFMSQGHMAVGITKDTLMVRIGPVAYANALQQPHVREMDFTGRPMKGYVFIDPPGFETDADLIQWIEKSLNFVRTLPAKPPK